MAQKAPSSGLPDLQTTLNRVPGSFSPGTATETANGVQISSADGRQELSITGNFTGLRALHGIQEPAARNGYAVLGEPIASAPAASSPAPETTAAVAPAAGLPTKPPARKGSALNLTAG